MKKLLLITCLLSTNYCHAQWIQLELPTTADVVSSSFITDEEGWIGTKNTGTYAIIFHTINIGDTWTADTVTGASGGSTYLQFVSTQVGYCVINGEAFKTPDGGASWNQLSLPGIPYNKPCFLNEDTGFIIGDEEIFKTMDGGQTWAAYPVGGILFNELHFINDSSGIACEYDGYLYGTGDGGQTWDFINDGGLWSYFYSACLSPDSKVYYTGYTDVFSDVTVDIYGGINFYSSYEVGHLYDIRAYTPGRIYAAGQYGDIVYTEDGGATWFNFNLPGLLGLSEKTLLTLDGFHVIYAFGQGGRGYKNITACVFFSDFNYAVNEFQVQFTNLTPGADYWVWTFDDGTTSTQQHPLHNYAEDGNYHVCLVASNDTCTGYASCQDVFVCGSNISSSSIGSLDTTFSEDGLAIEDLDVNYYGYCKSFAIQPDHKIVAHTYGYDAMMIRLNYDGTPDNSFSNDGIVNLSDDSNSEQLALTSDDKILVAGTSAGAISLIRYDSDGSKDLTFGTNGKALVDPTIQSDNIGSLIIQNDKIIMLDAYSQPGSSMHVIRLNADASFDLTFSGDGIADLPNDDLVFFNADYGEIIGLNNGKLALAVTTNTPDDDFAVIRLNSDGSMDSTFHGDGMAITSFSGVEYGDYPTDLAEQPDGKLIVIGYSDEHIAAARYNLNGSLDATFGNAGKVTFQINNNISRGYAVALQSDGKILITGTEKTNLTDRIILVRLNTDGSIDPSFGNNGYVSTSWNCTQSFAYGVAVDEDKIYVGGGVDGISNGDLVVIRYLNACPGSVADFDYTDTELSVQFTDQSTGAASWYWEFGDGANSTDQNPLHVYTQEGSYQICLTTTDTCGSNLFCETIPVCNALNTDYTYQATGLTVQFSNPITEALTFLWNFGDGTTSTQQNPVHTFSASGTYYVCLSETDECTSDADCHNIVVCGILNAGFSFVQNGNEIFFTDASSNALSYLWDFGDGTTSTDQSPSHTYALPGTYEVCLIASNDCSSDTVCELVTIIATAMESPDNLVELHVFPNPFTDHTTIQFSLQRNMFLKLILEDIQGREIKTIAEGNFEAGKHQLILEKENLPAGIYMLQWIIDSAIVSQKLFIQ